jgi:PAS domain S-box-containing protein
LAAIRRKVRDFKEVVERVPAMVFLDKLRLKEPFSKTADVKQLADYRQSLADRSEEGVAVIGLDGKLQFVNGAWASMHGYDNREELLGGSIRRFYAGRVADDVNRFIAQTKLLGWYIATVEQLRKDGTCFPAQLKMAVLKDDSANPCAILLIVADTSRLSQMQKTIQRTTEEIEQLKVRLGRLEEALAHRNQPGVVAREPDNQPDAAQPPLPLPITELKQLAEMAKRFR